jgi:hypothetical protein
MKLLGLFIFVILILSGCSDSTIELKNTTKKLNSTVEGLNRECLGLHEYIRQSEAENVRLKEQLVILTRENASIKNRLKTFETTVPIIVPTEIVPSVVATIPQETNIKPTETKINSIISAEINEQNKRISIFIESATKNKSFNISTNLLRQCNEIVGEQETKDNCLLFQKIALAKETCLGNEIDRLLSELDLIHGIILANCPSSQSSTGVYSNESSYSQAMENWRLFSKHNANVARLDKTALIAQSRIKELRDLQTSRSDVLWKYINNTPEALLNKVSELQRYSRDAGNSRDGQKIVILTIPTMPKLIVTESHPSVNISPRIMRDSRYR